VAFSEGNKNNKLIHRSRTVCSAFFISYLLLLLRFKLFMDKLKKRWGIESNWAIIAILVVFAINGSFAAWVAKPVTNFFGITPETINPSWLYLPIRILLIFPIYQLTLPIVGWLFGQFKFFWNFEKKFLTRVGLGFLFKK